MRPVLAAVVSMANHAQLGATIRLQQPRTLDHLLLIALVRNSIIV